MATGMEANITIPLRKRPHGLLIQNASPLGSIRWRAGVVVEPIGCEGFSVAEADYCDWEAEPLDESFATGDSPTFAPFSIYGTETCQSLTTDIDLINSRLDARWEVMVSEQLGARLEGEMATYASVVTTGPINSFILVSMVEQDLAQALHGGLGYVHMSPGVLAAVQEYLQFRDGNWETPSGHIVISDPGYTGLPPVGGSGDDPDQPAGTEWVYTSGTIAYALGEPRKPDAAVEYLDRSRNTITGRIIADAILAFEPCAVSAIQYGFPDYTPEA